MSDASYLRPYRHWATRNGVDFGVTLWASPRSQRRRFEVFSELTYLQGKRILDAGCSRGDFAHFLNECDIAYETYVGIDALPEVVEFARSRKMPRCGFHMGDILVEPGLFAIGNPQVICISGTLNTMSDDQATTVLESAWQATSQTLMFNFLSNRCGKDAPPQDDFARRHDTMRLLDWAFRQTWNVVFRQDYFHAGHDATIMMRK